MTETVERLKAALMGGAVDLQPHAYQAALALADRHEIERQIGQGSMATVSQPSVAYTPS